MEDHDGILEASLNGVVIYSNHRECCQEFLPEIIVRDIGEAIASGNLPAKDLPGKCGEG
jgi:hypothetical protein